MSKLHLEELPAEVINLILTHLNLPSIRSLRHTSTTIAAKCQGPQWFSFFARQETDLEEQSLQRLSEIVAAPTLRGAVRSVTVVANVYGFCRDGDSADEELVRSQLQKQNDVPRQANIDGLADIFRRLGVISTIELTARVFHDTECLPQPSAASWSLVWPRASETLRTVLSAIAKSKAQVQSLLCYNSTLCCSVQSIDVTRYMPSLQSEGFADAGAYLTNFSLTWSPCISAIREALAKGPAYELASARSPDNLSAVLPRSAEEFNSPDNFTGIAQLLGTMPNLRALDLHMHEGRRRLGLSHKAVFEEIAKYVEFKALQRIRLRGLYVSTDSLIQFFSRNTSITEIHLHEIRIDKSESWNTVFAFLSEESMPHLEILHISGIWKGAEAVNLVLQGEINEDEFSTAALGRRDPSYQTWLPRTLGGPLLHTRTFQREQIRRGLIVSDDSTGILMSSPPHSDWIRMRQIEYHIVRGVSSSFAKLYPLDAMWP